MTYPTPYPDVNAVLDALLSGARSAVADRFVGLYLYGSLATGDFDPERSDIDIVVVTTSAFSDEMVSTLEKMHAQLSASGLKWATKLEGTYIPQPALRRYDPSAGPFPCINEGRFYLARHESDWIIQRCILREHGAIVAGPSLRDFIDPVPPNDLRRAVLGYLHEWWSPMLRNPSRLRGREYQVYAILSMCRALYTLQFGTVVSKLVAARWAQETFDKRWSVLIERATAWPRGDQLDTLEETRDFIGRALERSQQYEAATAVLPPT